MDKPNILQRTERLLTREQLGNRHRLSSRQINDWLGESKGSVDQLEVMQSLAQVAEFLNVTDAFRAANIPFISFKGPLLAQKIYGDATYRYYKDFDFLIERDEIPRALLELQKQGFLIQNSDLPTDKCKLNLWLDHNNQIELYHPSRGVSIELHSRLFKLTILPITQLTKLVQENTVSTDFHGREFKVFSHEFELVYLIIHGGMHYWSRLKWLVDLKELANRFPLNETKFIALTNVLKAGHLVALCNALLSMHFQDSKQFPNDRSVSQKLLKHTLKTIASEDVMQPKNIRDYILFFMHRANLFSPLRYKISVVKTLFFASDLASKKWMPCSVFMNYLIGPIWKIFRGIRLIN